MLALVELQQRLQFIRPMTSHIKSASKQSLKKEHEMHHRDVEQSTQNLLETGLALSNVMPLANPTQSLVILSMKPKFHDQQLTQPLFTTTQTLTVLSLRWFQPRTCF